MRKQKWSEIIVQLLKSNVYYNHFILQCWEIRNKISAISRHILLHRNQEQWLHCQSFPLLFWGMQCNTVIWYFKAGTILIFSWWNKFLLFLFAAFSQLTRALIDHWKLFNMSSHTWAIASPNFHRRTKLESQLKYSFRLGASSQLEMLTKRLEIHPFKTQFEN